MKSVYGVDLHCHTTCSDGADTPKELIDHAAEHGVKVLAITDHDIIPPEFILLEKTGETITICEYAKAKGILLIKGIEISCETEVEDVHIICFGCDWKSPYFEQLESDTVESKVKGYRLLVQYLQEDGKNITWNEVLYNNGNPVQERQVQKKMIFELLARKGYADDWSAAKLMVKATARYQIKRKKPDPCNVIQEVHRNGGYGIMAHPFLVKEPIILNGTIMSREVYIEKLIAVGLDGIEACYPYNKTSYGGNKTKQEIECYIRTKYTNRLKIISGGSDYHADYKKGVKNPRNIGECGVTEEYFKSNVILQTLE